MVDCEPPKEGSYADSLSLSPVTFQLRLILLAARTDHLRRDEDADLEAADVATEEHTPSHHSRMSPRNLSLSLLVNMNTYPRVSTIPYSASAAATEGVGEGRDGVRAGVPAAECSAGLVPAPQRPCLEGHLRRYVSHCMIRDCTEYVCVWIRRCMDSHGLVLELRAVPEQVPALASVSVAFARLTRGAGEGATDAGGPYRESISTLCSELQSSALPLLIPTPNAREVLAFPLSAPLPLPVPPSICSIFYLSISLCAIMLL